MSDAIQKTLREALVTGDLPKSIEANTPNLTKNDKEVLTAIKPEDLAKLKAIEISAREVKQLPSLTDEAIKARKGDWIGGIW